MSSDGFQESMLERVLATLTNMLIDYQHDVEASVVINARPSLMVYDDSKSTVYWNLSLALPSSAFINISSLEPLETNINEDLKFLFKQFPNDEISCSIVVDLEPENDDWRILARQRLSGEGITNQGRVRSDNIAARAHDGLLFRSKPETLFYDALKAYGDIPFAPLPTVVAGRVFLNGRRRMEPDFLLFKDDITMVVEIDGDWTHRETPLAADQRAAVLKDEGVLFERIPTPHTPQEAREAVEAIRAKIEKIKMRRR